MACSVEETNSLPTTLPSPRNDKAACKGGSPLALPRKFKRCGWGATYCLPKLCDKGPRLHTAPVTFLRMGLFPTHLLGSLPATSSMAG